MLKGAVVPPGPGRLALNGLMPTKPRRVRTTEAEAFPFSRDTTLMVTLVESLNGERFSFLNVNLKTVLPR